MKQRLLLFSIYKIRILVFKNKSFEFPLDNEQLRFDLVFTQAKTFGSYLDAGYMKPGFKARNVLLLSL